PLPVCRDIRPLLFSFFFYVSRHHRALHSFPTRRSSDLTPPCAAELFLLSFLGCPSPPPAGAADRSTSTGSTTITSTRAVRGSRRDRKSTRLNSSHDQISYAVFCLKKKKKKHNTLTHADT